MRDDAVLHRALPLGRGLGCYEVKAGMVHLQCKNCVIHT